MPEKKVEETNMHAPVSVATMAAPAIAEPIMPHLAFGDVEMEELYPRLVAPADEHLGDPTVDISDLIFQTGQRIADDIRSTMRTEGRRRRILR